MKREDVYKLIDGERDYQDKRWGGEYDDSKWAINDWVVFIERYVLEAKNRTGYARNGDSPLDAIRKIAALAVACMEYNDTGSREE